MDAAKFLAKTAAALAEQVAVARAARRYAAHRPCADNGACRHCTTIRDAHASINDHLDQIDLVRHEQELSA